VQDASVSAPESTGSSCTCDFACLAGLFGFSLLGDLAGELDLEDEEDLLLEAELELDPSLFQMSSSFFLVCTS